MDSFEIIIPKESQFEAVMNFVLEDFLQRERCCVASGLSSEILQREDEISKNIIIKSLQEGLSFVVINQHDQSVSGICINVSQNDSDVHEDMSKLLRSHQTIMTFAATVKNENKEFEVFKKDKRGLHLWMLGVKQIYSGKGLARLLAEKTVELAQKQGFDYVESLATAPATLHLFSSLGFQKKSEMNFQDYILEDNTPGFPFATPEDLARFTVKLL